MSRVCTLRALRSSDLQPSKLPRFNSRRLFASKPGEPASSSGQKIRARLERLNSRVPRFLQSYTSPLLGAPFTHITAFLVLHELTAIVPLVGLTGIFHYTEWLPAYLRESKTVGDLLERFHSYLEKKRWLGEEKSRRRRWLGKGYGLARLPVEIVTAYAIIKVLMPVRIVVSVAATPWFARVAIDPVKKFFSSTFKWDNFRAL